MWRVLHDTLAETGTTSYTILASHADRTYMVAWSGYRFLASGDIALIQIEGGTDAELFTSPQSFYHALIGLLDGDE